MKIAADLVETRLRCIRDVMNLADSLAENLVVRWRFLVAYDSDVVRWRRHKRRQRWSGRTRSNGEDRLRHFFVVIQHGSLLKERIRTVKERLLVIVILLLLSCLK